MGSKRVGHDWVTELNWTELNRLYICHHWLRSSQSGYDNLVCLAFLLLVRIWIVSNLLATLTGIGQITTSLGFLGGSESKICLQCRRPGFDPWVRKIPWRTEWQPTPIFLPGEFHGQRNLVGYRLWGRKESDTTERLTLTYPRLSLTISDPPFGTVLVQWGNSQCGSSLKRGLPLNPASCFPIEES